MLLHEVSVGVRQAKLAREGCNQEQSLKYVYKDYLAAGTPTSSAATLIIFPAQFSAWANQIRWRWTLVSKLVQCQTSNSPQQGRKWNSSPLHHYQVPCKSMALSQLSYLTRSAWSCFQVYVLAQQMPVCAGRERRGKSVSVNMTSVHVVYHTPVHK